MERQELEGQSPLEPECLSLNSGSGNEDCGSHRRHSLDILLNEREKIPQSTGRITEFSFTLCSFDSDLIGVSGTKKRGEY